MRSHAAAIFLLGAGLGPLQAQTISNALAAAYASNPELNAQRAGVRSSDEGIGRAAAGYRPQINATLDAGFQYTAERQATPGTLPGSVTDSMEEDSTRSVSGAARYTGKPRGVAVGIRQTLFDGGRTFNAVRQAESQVLSARETMRLVEQNVLLGAASNYMNVLRDTAILSLRRNNISVLIDQVRRTRDRREAGEVNQTDLAQATASLAQARSDFFSAQSNLQSSIAGYRQVVGSEPRRLSPALSLERLLPWRLDDAVAVSQTEHPAITAALHQLDVAALEVKTAEGALLPTVTLNGAVSQRADFEGIPHYRGLTASISGRIDIPLYQGGGEYAFIRQTKELVSQARLNADLQRDQVRAALVTAWGLLEAAKAQIASGQAAVAAAEIALYGIREEAAAGQRTTFDVLTAQRNLLNARVNFVIAQRDRVVGSYSVLASMGRLNVATLQLHVESYDPTVHFDQVKGKLFGTQTSDGQ